MRLHLDVNVHGLGFSWVGVTLPDLGLQTRQFVCPSPTDAGNVELRIAMQIRENYRDLSPPLRWMPRALMTQSLLWVGIRNYWKDVMQDVPFWTKKVYVDPPALAEGDGPIGLYRKWAKQFYPDPAHSRAQAG